MWNPLKNFMRAAFTEEAYSVTSVTLNEHAAAHIFRKTGEPKTPLTPDDILILDEDSVKPENFASTSENHFVTENDPDAERQAAAKTFEQSDRAALAVVFCNMCRFREKEDAIASTLNRCAPARVGYFPTI